MRVVRALVAMLALVYSMSAWSQWVVEEKVDAMTDEKRKSATVTNVQGHKLAVYRLSPGGPVWINFALSETSVDLLSGDKPPMFRIDKNEPHDLSNEKRLNDLGAGIRSYSWEPKWVNALIWHGRESEGRNDVLLQLMQGAAVVFRYHLATGGYKDTDFSLNGAGPAIGQALQIDTSVDSAKQVEGTEFRKAYADEMTKCLLGKTSKPCSTRVKECRVKARGNSEAFRSCVAS